MLPLSSNHECHGVETAKTRCTTQSDESVSKIGSKRKGTENIGVHILFHHDGPRLFRPVCVFPSL